MKKILLIAGTADARKLADQLALAGHQVFASVATAFGAETLSNPAVNLIQGKKDSEQLQELLRQITPDCLVDASHPFAQAVSENAMAACIREHVPYLRLERARTLVNHEGVHYANTFSEAAEIANAISHQTEGAAFLTIGSNHLDVFVKQIAVERLFVRVLPLINVIEKCERLGLGAGNIFAAKGPFSIAMNLAMIDHCGAGVLVSKDSGDAGGLREKLRACQQANIALVVVRRPELAYPVQFTDANELISYLER